MKAQTVLICVALLCSACGAPSLRYKKDVNRLIAAQDFKGDILVTENGLSTDDDVRRIAFIGEATDGVIQAMKTGIPVKGYLYWTLMDNFEWQKAYGPKFGLIAVDRKTMERKPKESLAYLGSLYNKFQEV